MKSYALPRVDGGVEIMWTDIDPNDCIAKWHPNHIAELTGEVIEVQPGALPTDRKYRNAWKCNGTAIEVCPVKRAEIDQWIASRKQAK